MLDVNVNAIKLRLLQKWIRALAWRELCKWLGHLAKILRFTVCGLQRSSSVFRTETGEISCNQNHLPRLFILAVPFLGVCEALPG